VAISFNGEFDAQRNPDEVFDFLSDPQKFGALFPDFESMTSQDATHFIIKLRVSVGNLSGSAELAMELAEATRPQRALYKGTGSAVGSQIGMRAGFDLSPQPEGTRVAWQGEASIAGKLASLGPMLEPVVKKNLEKLIDALRWALYMPAGAVAEGAASDAVTGEATAPQPTQSEELQPGPAPIEQRPTDSPGLQQPALRDTDEEV